MTSTFSQTYINSTIVKSLLEGVPEDERATLLEHLRLSMEQYDHLTGIGWEKTSIAEALHGKVAEAAQLGDRRPPRRR